MRPRAPARTPAQARARLSHATTIGEIERPTQCPACQRTPKPNALKKSQMFALFREGFQNWRSVDWLCICCFRARQGQS